MKRFGRKLQYTYFIHLPLFEMATKIYINLPVIDLPKATAFYEAIWFTKSEKFSNDDASGLSRDDTIYVMLLTHKFTKTFVLNKEIADSHKTCEVLNALQFDTKEEVDNFYDKVIKAGGREFRPTYDYGFMYGRDVEDLDGHVREAFWMDISQMPDAQ